jgi:hypothetical protein
MAFGFVAFMIDPYIASTLSCTQIIVKKHPWFHDIDCLKLIAMHVIGSNQEACLVSVVAPTDADVQLAMSKVGVACRAGEAPRRKRTRRKQQTLTVL